MRSRNLLRLAIIRLLSPLFWLAAGWPAPQAQRAQIGAGFEQTIQPFPAAHCYDCHNAQLNSGGLNLEAFATAASVIRNREQWELDFALDKLLNAL
jgi:hypothetical protein